MSTARNWRITMPVPMGLSEAPRADLTEYLSDAFDFAFGRRPSEITYETFPDGLYAGLIIGGRLKTEHNVWGVIVAAALRNAGVNVNVVVRAESELEDADREHLRMGPLLTAKARRVR